MKAKVKAGQTVIDIAVQYLGSQEAAFELAALNDISITEVLASGSELELPDPTDKRVVAFFEEGQYFPAVGSNLGQGVGFWAIGTTNKVG